MQTVRDHTEQSTWSNDTNRCDLTHSIVGGGGGTGTEDVSLQTSFVVDDTALTVS